MKGYLYHYREWRLKNAPDHCCCKLNLILNVWEEEKTVLGTAKLTLKGFYSYHQ